MIARRVVHFLMGGMVLMGLLFSAPLAAAGQADELFESLSDREKLTIIDLIDQGTEAYQSGEFEKALSAYLEVYGLFPHPDILYRIGLSYERLGHEELAVDHYRRFLKAVPEAADRGRIEGTIALLERRIASRESYLRVVTAPQGAAVYIDDRSSAPLGESPAELRLAPGGYRVFVEKQGFEAHQEEVEVIEGQTVILRLTLRALEEQAEENGGEAKKSTSRLSLWEPLTAAALLGFGGWALVQAVGHRREYQHSYGELERFLAENVRAGNEAQLQRHVDEVNRARRMGIVTGAASGVAFLGATTLLVIWLRDDGDEDPAPGFSVEVSAGLGGPVFGFRGRF